MENRLEPARHWVFLLSIVIAIGATGRAAADSEIAIKLVGGKPCARCSLTGPGGTVPVNMVIDLGVRAPLVIHHNTSELLRIPNRSEVKLRFEGYEMPSVTARVDALPWLEELSALYARDLGEIPAVGIMGLPAFEKYEVTLDLGNGVLRLKTKDAEGESVAEGESTAVDGVCIMKYAVEGHGYWLKMEASDGFELRAKFSSFDYDTTIDGTVADLAGAPAGELDELMLGSINVAKYVAFRPEDLTEIPSPHPDVVLGTGFLRHFAVAIDAAKQTMSFKETSGPSFPYEEREFFLARYEDDAGAVEAFLTKHGQSRLAGEASDLLIRLRGREKPVDREAFRRAVRLRAESLGEERRAADLVALSDSLMGSGLEDKHLLAGDVLDAAKRWASEDLNAVAGYDILARQGKIALLREDFKEARRCLLSAAFGKPRDPMVNLWMGELYEKTGKLTRAWSRYIQSALDEDAPRDAFVSLDRLNGNEEFRSTFSMRDAEELLEGRSLEFHAPDRYSRDEKSVGRCVKLIEMFSCVDVLETASAELAFGGLQEYVEDQDVVFVQYHLAQPAPDPLVSEVSTSRAKEYGVESVPVCWFDGVKSVAAGGEPGAEVAVYSRYKKAALDAEVGETDWKIGGKISVSGDEVLAELSIDGPAANSDVRLFVLLCEKSVFVPGTNGVLLHRNVVRGSLSPLEGSLVSRERGTRAFAGRCRIGKVTEELKAGIAAIESAEKLTFTIRPTFIDINECVVAAFVQEMGSKHVLAVGEFDVAASDAGAEAGD